MRRPAFALMLALLCTALILLPGCSKKGGAEKRLENNIAYYYTPEDTSTRFICNNTLLEDKLGGEVDAFLTCDGSVGIARVGTGLYRVDESGVLMIYPAGVDRALLTADNSRIVFTTATEVHTYDHSTGELSAVDPEDAVSILSIVASPDGGTVGFTAKYADGTFACFAYENGESRKLTNGGYIIGIADNADFWYYLTADAEFHYAASGKDKLLGKDAASLFEFNRDMTEAAFDMNGVTYLSRNGGSAKRLIEGESVLATAGECTCTQGGEGCTAYVRQCDSLLGAVFYDYKSAKNEDDQRTVYDLWYVDGGCRATALARGAYQFSISKDRQTLVCLLDGSLYRMSIDDPGTAVQVAGNVYSYVASADLGRLYCIGYDRTLYCIEDFGKPERLMDGAVYCVITDAGRCLCIGNYDETGDLFAADGSAEPSQVGSKVYIVETKPAYCCYYSAPYTDESGRTVYDLYTSGDGLSFELALSGVKLITD